jgi:hypothetical protein
VALVRRALDSLLDAMAARIDRDVESLRDQHELWKWELTAPFVPETPDVSWDDTLAALGG